MEMDLTGIHSNFYLHFSPEFFGSIYRKRQVFQRLILSEKELANACIKSGKEYHEKTRTKEEHYQTIFPAYQFMEANVHIEDRDVIDKNGILNEDYLFI
jgi:hypothetical protein